MQLFLRNTISTKILFTAVIAAMQWLAMAPVAVATDAAASGSDSLEEIQVVAQKQNIELQKAPVALTALSGDAMAQLNIVNPIDLNGQVPGLVITTSEGYNSSVSIRGIGFNVPQDDSAQTSVSYHEDGIYIAFPVALDSGFLDVDHVEVLRGPQGTVFGQNAIGGTINVISKQPTFDEVKGYAEASTGSRDLIHTSAAVNLPVSSTFAIRLAYDQNYQHGYVTATGVQGYSGGYDLNDINNVHGRIQALWQASDELSIVLRAEYAQARQKEAEGKNINDPNSNPYQESSDWPGRMIYNQQLAAGTITYDFSAATLKALSSYQEVNHHGSVNEDGLSLAITNPIGEPHDVEWFEHNSKSITEELNLSSKPGGNIDWIVGAFYLKSRTTVAYDQYNLFAGDPTLNGDPSPNLLGVGTLNTATPVGQFIQNSIYSGQLYFANVGSEGRDSFSGYGQATYHFTDALRLTAGLRYTHDHNTTWFDDFYNLFYPNEAISVAQTADKTTYRVALDYDLTPVNLVYGSVSTGFKPGGGNISNSPLVVPFQFQPETITAYEIGSKNSFLDKKLNVNLATFLYRDKNMQFQAEDLINFQGGVDNIPDVQIYGLEGEIAALLPWNLRLDSNFTWEKGRITSHFEALDNVSGLVADQTFINTTPNGFCVFYGCNGSTGVGFNGVGSPALNALRQAAYRDVYGNAPPSLPDIIATVNLSHTLALPDGSSLLSRASVQYRADYADTIFGKTPTYTAPSYTMVNLFFNYTLPEKSWDFSFAVNNVFDREAVLSRFTNQFGGETTQLYAPPREFVVGAHYKF
jgi:iron complex outermembrane receptor protein